LDKISSTILTTPLNKEQEMFYLYRLIATWTCMNVNDFTIQGEDYDGKRIYLSLSDIIIKGQFRMLRVNFIPYQHRNEPIFLEPLECDNMIKFNIANEYGIYKSITVNELLKIRTLKKILKYHFSKEEEWPTIECLDDNFFNDYTQLSHFHQYSDTMQVKFYPDEPEDVYIKFRNGDFKTQISIRDNFQKLKKRLISNFYIGKDVIIGDAFGNEYNPYSTIMPIKDELYLHIPIRDNLNNTTIWKMAELKNTNIFIKSINGRFNIETPYFTAWNVDAIKHYINMLSGTNDKEVTIKINNYCCDFEESIEFINGIFSIKGNIKNHLVKAYTKSLAIPFTTLNIQMIIITYGGRMSPKHCWNNFSFEQAIEIWRSYDDRMPKNAEIWLDHKKMTMTQFPISDLKWNSRINLLIKREGGDPNQKTMMIKGWWDDFFKMAKSYDEVKRNNIWRRDEVYMNRYRNSFNLNTITKAMKWDEDKLTIGTNRLKIVTEECFQLISYIVDRIGNINSIKYMDEEKEKSWEYKEFDANEYQTDLFFIRNSDRIKLVFNVIKKSDPKIMKKKCEFVKKL
jgi:hypothetical protein